MYVPLFLCLDLCDFLKDDKLVKQKKVLYVLYLCVTHKKKPSVWKAFKDSIRTELSS